MELTFEMAALTFAISPGVCGAPLGGIGDRILEVREEEGR